MQSEFSALVAQALVKLALTPEQVLSAAQRDDAIVVVTTSGQKLRCAVQASQQPAVPEDGAGALASAPTEGAMQGQTEPPLPETPPQPAVVPEEGAGASAPAPTEGAEVSSKSIRGGRK